MLTTVGKQNRDSMNSIVTKLLARSLIPNPKLTTTATTPIARLSSTHPHPHPHRFCSSLSASSEHESDPIAVGNSLTSPRQIKMGTLFPHCFDTGRYICEMQSAGLEYTSEEDMLNDYVKTLTYVVGSEEEAWKKIYLISCDDENFSFGAEIDEEASKKLQYMPGVAGVIKDFYSDAIAKFSKAQSPTKFIPRNWNNRLFNIHEYSKSFKGEKVEDPGHWLFRIRINQHCDHTVDEIADYCVELLTKVLGSKEEAIASMYITWCVPPFGFGAEIDKKTATELCGLPNVIEVLPDYAFDIKDKHGRVLIINRPLLGDYRKRPFYMYLDPDDPLDS
ncbi:Multiple organellar rna editing factor 5 protein [Thalictrum thalictroides]|uniref:Multiple organellar rna editing factor 5 protein n=1 Tax=Thalictrum thalictroides TaxID=46969 RepID=A0A7J6X2T0_THATH|nr:Multiple organellar rna editing factor 5 protein [Thalictrum thalictroides]